MPRIIARQWWKYWLREYRDSKNKTSSTSVMSVYDTELWYIRYHGTVWYAVCYSVGVENVDLRGWSYGEVGPFGLLARVTIFRLVSKSDQKWPESQSKTVHAHYSQFDAIINTEISHHHSDFGRGHLFLCGEGCWQNNLSIMQPTF